MQDELIASYMTVLNESNESEVKGAPKPSKESAFGAVKTGNDADENVDLDKPSDDKELSTNVKDGEPKKLKESNNSFKNPFDELYNKIVSENSFGFSTEDENEIQPSDEGDAFGGGSDDLGDEGLGSDLGGEEGLDDELGGDIEDLDGLEGDEEVDLGVLVTTLKDVLSQLEKIVGDEEGEEEEIDDIEDIDDEDDFGGEESEESEEGESEEDESEEEEGDENPFKEGYREKQWEKKNAAKKKEKKGLKGKFARFEKNRGNKTDDVAEEAVKVTGLKKGVNLTPFKGNIKTLQSKKAEVKGNSPKAAKGKAQTPSTGKGHDGVPSKLSPTAGHNLMKASSHTVSGAVKPGKGLFEQ